MMPMPSTRTGWRFFLPCPVELILNPGCDLKSSQTAVELAERFPFVYAAVGVHPEECADWNAEHDIPVLEALAQNPKVRAIGEIGLDYHWPENPPRELQQQVFHAQLDLAEKLNLPVIVHDRDAHHDCLEIVRAHPNVTGVYHCYSGGVEDAKTLMKLGWMISFTGSITFKNARRTPPICPRSPSGAAGTTRAGSTWWPRPSPGARAWTPKRWPGSPWKTESAFSASDLEVPPPRRRITG